MIEHTPPPSRDLGPDDGYRNRTSGEPSLTQPNPSALSGEIPSNGERGYIREAIMRGARMLGFERTRDEVQRTPASPHSSADSSLGPGEPSQESSLLDRARAMISRIPILNSFFDSSVRLATSLYGAAQSAVNRLLGIPDPETENRQALLFFYRPSTVRSDSTTRITVATDSEKQAPAPPIIISERESTNGASEIAELLEEYGESQAREKEERRKRREKEAVFDFQNRAELISGRLLDIDAKSGSINPKVAAIIRGRGTFYDSDTIDLLTVNSIQAEEEERGEVERKVELEPKD